MKFCEWLKEGKSEKRDGVAAGVVISLELKEPKSKEESEIKSNKLSMGEKGGVDGDKVAFEVGNCWDLDVWLKDKH